MSETKDGGPAFPTSTWREEGGVQIGTPQPGISKREYYAAAALQGWLARYTPDKGVPDIGHTADFCFKVADAMVKRSEQE